MKIGFIYLLFAFPRCVFKIGVTINPKRRVQDINDSVKRQLIIPLFLVFVFNYEDKEEKLHGLFKRKRFTYRGSGKTEYFRLNVFQLIAVIALMVFYQIDAVFKTGLILGVIIFLVWIIRNV